MLDSIFGVIDLGVSHYFHSHWRCLYVLGCAGGGAGAHSCTCCRYAATATTMMVTAVVASMLHDDAGSTMARWARVGRPLLVLFRTKALYSLVEAVLATLPHVLDALVRVSCSHRRARSSGRRA